jgi:hypothetical protein
VLDNSPANVVEVKTSTRTGIHNIQCLAPSDTERAIRICRRLIDAIMRRHVCRIVTAIHSLIADAGLVAIWSGEEPNVASVTISQVKRESATRSSPANQIWHLSAGERDRKVGSPNSAYNGENEVVICLAKKRTHRWHSFTQWMGWQNRDNNAEDNKS